MSPQRKFVLPVLKAPDGKDGGADDDCLSHKNYGRSKCFFVFLKAVPKESENSKYGHDESRQWKVEESFV